jgi:putative zinc finger protein
MDHTAVVREKTTERYLLNELDPEVRDAFEEHYFSCPECAQDVSAGSQFVEQSKAVLAENSNPSPVGVVPDRGPGYGTWFTGGWFTGGRFAWLRPAVAAPALALLLAVAGYQSLVMVPRLQSELKQPQVLPAVSVNVGTWGAGGTPTSIPEGKGLLLFVRIPPDRAYARYTAELYNPGGKLEGSFTITATAGQDQWSVTVPAVHREAGTYTMPVHGITPTGEIKELGSASFELQIQR